MPGETGGPVVTTLVCFVFITHETAGALGARHSPRPRFFQGERFLHNPGASCRGNAEACREYERATFSVVIAREGGRSSIPETPVMESRSCGVLDRPVKPDDDSSLWRAKRRNSPSPSSPRKRGPITTVVCWSR